MREINRIIVHCSDTPDDRQVSVDEIRSWHKERGWSDIGYHYVIHQNGKIENGRPVAKKGAHCSGENHDSIGICLIGRNDFTKEQFASLNNFYQTMLNIYGNIAIFGHRDFTDKKTCPNFMVADVIL